MQSGVSVNLYCILGYATLLSRPLIGFSIIKKILIFKDL